MVNNSYEFLQVVNMCMNNKNFISEYLRLKGGYVSHIDEFENEYQEFKEFVWEFVYKPWKEGNSGIR